MDCVLFARMNQNKTLKKYWKMEKILEKSGKSQGILSVLKSGNDGITCRKENSLLKYYNNFKRQSRL